MNASEEASELCYVQLLARKFSPAKILRDATNLRILPHLISPFSVRLKLPHEACRSNFLRVYPARAACDSTDGIEKNLV